MSEVKRLVKNTMIIAIGSISTKLITFAMLPFYTAYLTTAEYGIYDYIFQIAMFVLPAITLLMDESVFRFLIDCKDDYDKKVVISNALILEIIGTVIFVILAYGLGTYFEINYLIYSIAYIVACVLATIVNPIMRGQGKYTLFTLFNSLISLFLTILSIVFLMIFNMGVEGLLLANTLAHFIMFVLFSVLLKIWLYIDLKSINLKKINEMIRYSSPLVLNRLAWIFINIANRIIIMEFLGAIIAGTFAVAYKFPLLVSTVYGFFGVSWQETCLKEVFTKDWPGVPERVRWRINSVRKIKQKTEEWRDKTMKKHIYDESNGLSYTLHGDYYLPDLAVNEEESTYGKYGMLRKQFLKEHRPARYQYLVMTGELTGHLNQVDQDAREQVEILVKQMAEK